MSGTDPAPSPVDAYIEGFDGETRARLEVVRNLIHEIVPQGVDTISYAIPTVDIDGKHLVHFAAFKNHIGLYPAPSGIAAFETELAPYRHAKGSVKFPHSDPLPVDLIRRIVEFRLAEHLRS